MTTSPIPDHILKKIKDMTGPYHVGKMVGEQPYYIGVIDGKLTWTADGSKKLHLSRQQDAEAIETLFPDAQFIVQLDVRQGGQ